MLSHRKHRRHDVGVTNSSCGHTWFHILCHLPHQLKPHTKKTKTMTYHHYTKKTLKKTENTVLSLSHPLFLLRPVLLSQGFARATGGRRVGEDPSHAGRGTPGLAGRCLGFPWGENAKCMGWVGLNRGVFFLAGWFGEMGKEWGWFGVGLVWVGDSC